MIALPISKRTSVSDVPSLIHLSTCPRLTYGLYCSPSAVTERTRRTSVSRELITELPCAMYFFLLQGSAQASEIDLAISIQYIATDWVFSSRMRGRRFDLGRPVI